MHVLFLALGPAGSGATKHPLASALRLETLRAEELNQSIGLEKAGRWPPGWLKGTPIAFFFGGGEGVVRWYFLGGRGGRSCLPIWTPTFCQAVAKHGPRHHERAERGEQGGGRDCAGCLRNLSKKGGEPHLPKANPLTLRFPIVGPFCVN